MEQTTQQPPGWQAPQINLFGDDLPSLDRIRKLAQYVRSSEANCLTFSGLVQEHTAKTSPKSRLAVGIALYILGRDQEAVEKLEKAIDCKEKFIYLAFALRRLGKFNEAIDNLQKSPQALGPRGGTDTMSDDGRNTTETDSSADYADWPISRGTAQPFQKNKILRVCSADYRDFRKRFVEIGRPR